MRDERTGDTHNSTEAMRAASDNARAADGPAPAQYAANTWRYMRAANQSTPLSLEMRWPEMSSADRCACVTEQRHASRSCLARAPRWQRSCKKISLESMALLRLTVMDGLNRIVWPPWSRRGAAAEPPGCSPSDVTLSRRPHARDDPNTYQSWPSSAGRRPTLAR